MNPAIADDTHAAAGITADSDPAHTPEPTLRRFQMIRHIDHSDFSGTGTVMEGIQFSSGQVALQWIGRYPSIVIWPNIDMALTVHGHGGDTHLRWLDDASGDQIPYADQAAA